jgi:hypothetical protein
VREKSLKFPVRMDPRRQRVDGRLRAIVPALLLVAYSLLTVSWVFSNAPFGAPDEAAHFVRAVGVSRGIFVGKAAPPVAPTANPEMDAWLDQANRTVEVPGGMSPAPFACEAPTRADISASCMNNVAIPQAPHEEVTPVGTYQPMTYLLPGAFLRLSNRAPVALRFGRMASAVCFLALLSWAVMLLRRADGDGWMAGLLVAVTPMVIFAGSSLQPSGPEIGGAFLLSAGLLRLADGDGTRIGTWIAIAAGGSVLALSKSLSPLWVVLILGVFLLWSGWEHLWTIARLCPRRVAITGAVLVVAILLNRAWEAAYGPTVPYNLPSGSQWSHALGEFTWVYRQEVGIFGYLETGMSLIAYQVWTLALAGVLGLALLVGQKRERRAIIVAVVANAFAPAMLYAVVLYRTGFEAQGRHVLPFAVALPLFAGYSLTRNRDRLRRVRPRWLLTYIAVMVGFVHLAGWYANARRHAVGIKGPILFIGHSAWRPPLGWLPWAFTAVVGAMFLVTAAAIADRMDTRDDVDDAAVVSLPKLASADA